MRTATPLPGVAHGVAYGAEDDQRHRLDQVYGAMTRAVIHDVGVDTGMRIVDLGCGAGDLTVWLARHAAPRGGVTAVDIDFEQLDIARENAGRQRISNITFLQAQADDTGLPAAAFDLVVCRFLLWQLSDPVAALHEMRRLLRPGGAVIVIEPETSSVRADPPASAYSRLVEAYVRLAESRGCDADIGPKLHRHFRAAGFAEPILHVEQPVFVRGEEKRFWEHTLIDEAPALVRRGFLTHERLTTIADGLVEVAFDEKTLVSAAAATAAWTRV